MGKSIDKEKKYDGKKVIIGSGELGSYFLATAFELQKSDEVIVSAVGKNIGTLERVVKILSDISKGVIHESERRYEKVDAGDKLLEATVVVIESKK